MSSLALVLLLPRVQDLLHSGLVVQRLVPLELLELGSHERLEEWDLLAGGCGVFRSESRTTGVLLTLYELDFPFLVLVA